MTHLTPCRRVLRGGSNLSAAGVAALALVASGCFVQVWWSFESVVETIVLGEPISLELEVTSAQNLKDVEVYVTPTIAPFVLAEPSKIDLLMAGQPARITLHLSASEISEVGAYEGAVRLRQHWPATKTGEKSIVTSLQKALPVNVTVSTVPLPPDPGSEGNATIAGIDSDGDGVRDDIQRSIALSHPESARKRAALSHLAVGSQEVLLNAQDPASAIRSIRDQLNDAACLYQLLGLDEGGELALELEAQLLNTSERFSAADLANRHFSGMSFPSYSPSEALANCDFDPSMPEDL